MSADARLRSLIDRILRLKEEQDTIGEDIKEIYAEAKGDGYDKTAMGSLVSELRKKGKDAAKFEEANSILDLYRDAYERASGTTVATHTHGREKFPDPHTPSVDGGRPDTSSDDGGAKVDGGTPVDGRAVEQTGAFIAQSGHQDAETSQGRNEPVVEAKATATNSKPECLKPTSCPIHFTSALCWQCNAVREKQRAAA